MNTNQIKKFACEARNILKRGIAAKITTLGFDAKGNVPESMMPQLMQGGSLWKGELHTEGFYRQWMTLYHRVKQKGIQEVYEEAAYTWFNRLMAIRIMQKNRLCEPVLIYTDSARTPRIVDEARMNRMPQMPEETRTHLMELLDDDTKVTEQFAVLITAWCHANPIMQACFGTLADYTELLLPQNILAEGGFVDMINHTEFITDDDFHSPELIGWLYQFYISERKDEVFAKKGKFEADEIPAATQIFTPNWIVKYMVQNTVGRIFLDNNPGSNPFKQKWQYLVDQEPQSDENIYHYSELTDLKVADLACGSGHILNECFDILYDLFIYEGYSRNEAIENIFAHNLTGIDLDNRAKQLATFALMIKACQKDSSFVDAHALPNVLTMPKPFEESEEDTDHTEIKKFISEFFQGSETKQITNELLGAFELMKDAESLGSIMKFDISESTRYALVQTVDYWKQQSFVPQLVQDNIPAIQLILTLTQKYSALVMNPPYMAGGNMNMKLSKYVKDNYENGKADLFSVFMILATDKLNKNGKYGMINMQSWMFLLSFEKLRKSLLDNTQIDNMLHLGPRTFDELSGEVVQNTAFVISNCKPNNNATYFRLVDGKNCSDKERIFISYNGTQDNKVYYSSVSQENFKKIPGWPLGYWVTENFIHTFEHKKIGQITLSDGQILTGNNDVFIRVFWETDKTKTGINSGFKWTLMAKGGGYRKWYGNIINTVNWSTEAREFYRTDKTARILSEQYWYREAVTWGVISTIHPSFRLLPQGYLFNKGGYSLFFNDDEDKNWIIGLLNSKYPELVLNLINPTLSTTINDVQSIPWAYNDKKNILSDISKKNIEISRNDWDAHETSWDFKENELLTITSESYTQAYSELGNINGILYDLAAPKLENLEWRVNVYKVKWEAKFLQLHKNEEELNRQFIDIYGLQDELTQDVPFSEITILQQGEISIENDNEIVWHDDVIIKQFISYAVGVWMGRYHLDKPGLHIAHPEPTSEELEAYSYGNETVNIDDDGIIPILPSGFSFDDNLCRRIADFVRIVFGSDSLTENLNFIEKCLGTTIEQYVMKDFWKDHKKMYQNRPIYWLFSSKKGAFKCITYMHRMTPYTAEQVRSKYLLPYIEQLQAKINDLENRAASLTTSENKQLTALGKTIEECREYHERLQVVAEDTNITGFDLDDGVIVNYAKYGDVLAKLK